MFVTFGESLFRSVTAKGERLAHAQNLEFYLGGTELNIAANLATIGIASTWVSCLPLGLTGEMIRARVEALGVDLSHCVSAKSARAGWYLMESGSSPRPDIVFHRNASAMADETEFKFDWPTILTNAQVFHTSGVACGLSEALTTEIKKAASAAREAGALFSYDLNYRKNIWSLEESVRRQKEIVPQAQILFCSDADLKLFYGDDFAAGNFAKVFSNSRTETLVMSQRNDDQREYGVDVITKNGNRAKSKRHRFETIDRIGVGDSMAAGYFADVLAPKTSTPQSAAEMAALCGALKYGIKGDMALLTRADIDRIQSSPSTGIHR